MDRFVEKIVTVPVETVREIPVEKVVERVVEVVKKVPVNHVVEKVVTRLYQPSAQPSKKNYLAGSLLPLSPCPRSYPDC